MTHTILDLMSIVYADKDTGMLIEATEGYLNAYRLLDDGKLVPWSNDAIRSFADVDKLAYLPLADLEDLAAEFAIELQPNS